MNYEEITITKHETEFVAKHKDYDVIGVGGNEFEAVLELSKALGALMFSRDIKAQKEHELLGLYQRMYDTPTVYKALRTQIVGRILQLEKELGEMK